MYKETAVSDYVFFMPFATHVKTAIQYSVCITNLPSKLPNNEHYTISAILIINTLKYYTTIIAQHVL